jgi:uncharacterized membrane protein YuzA (DUF378 family)
MMMKHYCGPHLGAMVLVIIGALNWGLVGFFDYNLVDSLFGTGSTVARIIYAVVGLCGLFMLSHGACKFCMMKMKGMGMMDKGMDKPMDGGAMMMKKM